MKEGDTHTFTVEKMVQIPEVEEIFFRLQSQSGKKFLMPSSFYQDYKIEINQVLNCRVDKINCSGKIFLEPEHPVYKIGQVHPFKYIKQSERTNSLGEIEKTVIVQDVYKNEWHCPINSIEYKLDQNGNISCKVLRIKKGRLYLSLEGIKKYEHQLILGETYLFKVENIKQVEGKEFYILCDPFKNEHVLNKDMYSHFGINPGQDISCQVTKFISDGRFKLEPDHPYYKIGEIYEFDTNRIESKKEMDGSISTMLWLKDHFKQDCRVKISEEKYQIDTLPTKINCKIEGFRKGTVLLSLV